MFSFGLADDQKFFNASCSNTFLDFWCPVFFFLITLQEEFSPANYYICWVCTSNKKWSSKNHEIQPFNHFVEFTEDQVLKSFSGRNSSLESHVFEFLTVFQMFRKNQGNFESWLVRFWVSRYSKKPIISVNNFFCIFEPLLWIY